MRAAEALYHESKRKLEIERLKLELHGAEMTIQRLETKMSLR